MRKWSQGYGVGCPRLSQGCLQATEGSHGFAGVAPMVQGDIMPADTKAAEQGLNPGGHQAVPGCYL